LEIILPKLRYWTYNIPYMKNDHVAVLLEDMNSKFHAVTELVTSVAKDVSVVKSDLAEVKTGLIEVKDTVRTIKAAVTNQTHELKDQNSRLRHLEHKVA
jgi:archaellum component FlaC